MISECRRLNKSVLCNWLALATLSLFACVRLSMLVCLFACVYLFVVTSITGKR